MRTKMTFILGFAAGYVLGAKAGRQRYEQISKTSRAVASNPAVQKATNKIQEQATGALSTAKNKATTAINERLHDRETSWEPIRSATGSGADTGLESGWAGSNGRPQT